MQIYPLSADLEFHDPVPYAQPLLVNQDIRILRWMLKPGQQIGEHRVPEAPFFVVVLQGRGAFTGRDGEVQEVGPQTLLVFEPDEVHTVRALDEELVFVSFMPGTEIMRPDRMGGVIGRE